MGKTFTILTSKPSKSDKYIYLYNNSKNGGKSKCISGKPTDSTCNVLSNCVGWACGRFNHIYNLLTGYDGIKYSDFCCNAEKFIEVAKAYGLEVGQTPKAGAIMCWQKGNTLNSSDGAGHVAVVEKVISSTQVLTSESGYNSFVFKNKTINKGSNGNWGLSSPYKFRGFIYNPAVDDTVKVTEGATTVSSIKKTSPVSRNAKINQIQVIYNKLNIRTSPSTTSTSLGFASLGYYNYTETKTSGGYTWYKIANSNWIAYSTKWAKVLPKTISTTTKTNASFIIGDTVTMQANAPIYGRTSKFASWVYKATLYVRYVNGDKITVSTVKSGPVTGSVDKKYLNKK